jgi:hypothetical protein
MITSEAEYRTKWCPLARQPLYCGGHATGVNRDDHGGPADGCRCLGGSCALWSWADASRSTGSCGLKSATFTLG